MNLIFIVFETGVDMIDLNEIITYGPNGVCRVVGLEEKTFMGVKKQYYILKPLKNNNNSTYYVPTDNEEVLSKIRKTLTKKEVEDLIDSMVDESDYWIANENERKEKYNHIISECNPAELIKMIKAIFLQKKECESKGKRLRTSDEQFFKEAEKLLYGEFQYVLKLNENELTNYIFDKIENKGK